MGICIHGDYLSFIYLFPALPCECSSYSMVNEHSFESFNDERLNTSDLAVQRKRERSKEKVKLYEKMVRRKSTGLVPFFQQTNIARVCLLRLLGRFGFQTLQSKCCIKHVAFVGPPRSTLWNIVQQCWNRSAGPLE